MVMPIFINAGIWDSCTYAKDTLSIAFKISYIPLNSVAEPIHRILEIPKAGDVDETRI
jgi:hypothetical protein